MLPTYIKGLWNAQCDQCGLVFKSDRLKQRWDNAMVCRECWEPRHPQDFVRPTLDYQSTPWARPWIPTLAQATTLTDITEAGNAINVSAADSAKLPAGFFFGNTGFLATITGTLVGESAPCSDYEVIALTRFFAAIVTPSTISNPGIIPGTGLTTGRGLNNTIPRAWAAGASIIALTDTIQL